MDATRFSPGLIGTIFLAVTLSASPAATAAAQDLAGLWFARGSVSCGGGKMYKLQMEDSAFSLKITGEEPRTRPQFEGTIDGTRITGKAFINWDLENGGIMTEDMVGSVTDGGQALTLVFYYIAPMATVGQKASGWGRFEVTCRYLRYD